MNMCSREHLVRVGRGTLLRGRGVWGQGRSEAYSNRAQKMMMKTLNVKMLAIPSAKPRIIDSTPSLKSCLSC